MPLWIVIGVAAAIFVLVIVLAASFNVFSAESAEETTERWVGLPAEFTSHDVEALAFRPALRGYRMDDVDEAVGQLRERISELETSLRQTQAVSTDSSGVAGAPACPETDLAGPTSPEHDAAERTETAHLER